MMATQSKKPSKNDFDFDEIVKTTSDHQKSLDDIQQALQQLANIVQPIMSKEQFALYFREAIDTQVPLQNAVTVMVKKAVSTPDLKDAISKEVSELDRKWWNKAWKKAFAAVGAVLLLLIGAIIGHFVK